MRRREFFQLAVGAVIMWPRTARAQQKAMPVIGYLNPLSHQADALAAFLEGLSETGYVEGQNVKIEYRSAEGNADRLPALAADLVAQKVDVIVAAAGTGSALAAKRATSTIPIIFTAVENPIASGLVASYARPGGNLTGFVFSAVSLQPKRFELLCELVPTARIIGLLINPKTGTSYYERVIRDMEEAARAKQVQLAVLKTSTSSEIDGAFASLVELRAGALFVATDPFFTEHIEQLVTLAERYAVPAIYHNPAFVTAGGLISYSVRAKDVSRGSGVYVGRILAGAKPADLPVQQPTKFELVINLKTAKALGLTVPPPLLSQADEVIE